MMTANIAEVIKLLACSSALVIFLFMETHNAANTGEQLVASPARVL